MMPEKHKIRDNDKAYFVTTIVVGLQMNVLNPKPLVENWRCFLDRMGLLKGTDSMSALAGQTYSIMDYKPNAPNTLLYKYQWDEVHDPKISLFGGSEEEVSEKSQSAVWELTIYSPYFSDLFEEAYIKRDYYRMRELTYQALNKKFEGEPKDWLMKSTLNLKLMQEIPANLQCAELTYNRNAAFDGVKVFLSHNSEIIEKGRKYNLMSIDYSDAKHYFPPYHHDQYYDAQYPIDIRLFQNKNPKNSWEGSWDDFYKGMDITGVSFGGDLNFLGYNSEGSIFAGYVRGYGYCVFVTTGKGGWASPGSSEGISSVYGKWIGSNNKLDAYPTTLEGDGSESTFGILAFSAGTWKSYIEKEKGTVGWVGSTYVMGISISWQDVVGAFKKISPIFQLIPTVRYDINTTTILIYPKPEIKK